MENSWRHAFNCFTSFNFVHIAVPGKKLRTDTCRLKITHALKSAAKPWEHLIGFCMSGGNVGLSLILFNFISNFSFSFITFNYWSNSCQVPLARLNRNYSFIFNFYGEWKPYEDNRQRNSDKIKTQSQHGNSSATNNQALLHHILEEWTIWRSPAIRLIRKKRS